MQLIKKLLFILPWFFILNMSASVTKKSTVLICYGKINPEKIVGYTYVIIESRYYILEEIQKIKSQNGKVFAYISLGEVNKNAPHYEELKGLTLGQNSTWDSYYLNLTSEKTISVLLNIIQEIFKDGYDGLFLDNIDNFTIYGPQKAQQKELINLLKFIRSQYLNKDFIQNSGLELISVTCPYINKIAVESVATDYTFTNKKYNLRNRKDYLTHINQINNISEAYGIPILLIEYADSKKLYDEISDRFYQINHEYFIGNIDLQNIPEFKN